MLICSWSLRKKNSLNDYTDKPFVWWRYIDDIFVLWEHGEDILFQIFECLK